MSHFSPGEIIGGTETLGSQFSRTMGLKYMSARKIGATADSFFGLSAGMDAWLNKIPEIELLVRNSTLGSTLTKHNIDRDIVVCCENFRAEAASMKDSDAEFYEEKTKAFEFQKACLDNAGNMITISPNEKELFKTDGYKSTVIEPHIDANVFLPRDVSVARKILGLPFDKQVVLYVGRVHKRKGFDIVVDVANEFPDVDFMFVTPPFETSILKNDNYRVCEDLTTEMLAIYYNAANLLLAPSRYESFGYIFAEALASGIPVVSGKVGVMADEILQRYGTIVDDINSKTVIKAVEKQLASETVVDVDYVKTRFGEDRFVRDCDDIINNW